MQVIEILTKSLILFENPNEFILEIYCRLLTSENIEEMTQATSAISDIVCMGTSIYSIKLIWDESEKNLKMQLFCHECSNLKYLHDKAIEVCESLNTPFKDRNLRYKIAKLTNSLFIIKNSIVKTNMINALPSYVRHVDFYTVDLVKKWMVFVGDDEKEIRKVFARRIVDIVRAVQVVFFSKVNFSF